MLSSNAICDFLNQRDKLIHFRYAWGRNPVGNLQSADHNDLPFATQRSDDWKIEEVPPGTWFADPNATYKDYRRQLSAQIKKDHRLSDMERHLKEAKAFVEEHRVQIEKDRRNLEEQKAKQKEKYRSEK